MEEKITDEEIKRAIKALENNTIKFDTPTFWIPRYKNVLSTRYKGRGRPRIEDYDIVEIDWSSIIKQITVENLLEDK